MDVKFNPSNNQSSDGSFAEHDVQIFGNIVELSGDTRLLIMRVWFLLKKLRKSAWLTLGCLTLVLVSSCSLPTAPLEEPQTVSPGEKYGSATGPSSETSADQAAYDELLAGRIAAGVIRQYALPIYTKRAAEIEAETAPREKELLDNLKKHKPGTRLYELDMARLNSLRGSKDSLLREAKREATDQGTIAAIDAVLDEALRNGLHSKELAAYIMLRFNEAKGSVTL